MPWIIITVLQLVMILMSKMMVHNNYNGNDDRQKYLKLLCWAAMNITNKIDDDKFTCDQVQ